MNLNNKRGDAFLSTVGLFGTIGTVPSVFIAIAMINVIIASQMTPTFRVKRAIEMCEVTGQTNCQEHVSRMNEEQVLAYIRDDNSERSNRFYSPVDNEVRRGGKLRARLLAMQK